MNRTEGAEKKDTVAEQQGLEVYEAPAVSELGTVEDLTWTGSTDTFYVSA